MRTTARTRPGRRRPRRVSTSARASRVKMLVMTPSLPLFLSRYQDTAYPGTDTTWQPARRAGEDKDMSVAVGRTSPASQRAAAPTGLTSDEGARREGGASEAARRRAGKRSELAAF